jgi:hypothetical protein
MWPRVVLRIQNPDDTGGDILQIIRCNETTIQGADDFCNVWLTCSEGQPVCKNLFLALYNVSVAHSRPERGPASHSPLRWARGLLRENACFGVDAGCSHQGLHGRR